jgi:type IV pilus assembly protein PilC
LWAKVDDRIQRGDRLTGPILESKLIPEPMTQMIDAGDSAGRLGFVFAQLADHAEEEYDQAVRTATQFIEPCMILFMGSTIGFVAASLMLPLFQSSMLAAK